MIRRYERVDEYAPGNEDYEYDSDRQRKLDEAASLQDAYIEGHRLGMAGFGREMNTYAPDSPEYAECERGRLNAIGWRLGGRIAA